MIPTDIGKGRGGIRSFSTGYPHTYPQEYPHSYPQAKGMSSKGLNVWYEIG